MADFLLDPLTGDLDFGINNSLGLQLCPNLQTEYEQRISQMLDINLGEWFADTSVYIPYIRNRSISEFNNIRFILGSKGSNVETFVKGVLDKAIADLDFVDKYTSSYTFDQANRTFTYEYSVKTKDGVDIEFNQYPLTL